MTDLKEIIEFCEQKYGESNSKLLADRITRYEKRSYDIILSKTFYFLTLIAEKVNDVSQLIRFFIFVFYFKIILITVF